MKYLLRVLPALLALCVMTHIASAQTRYVKPGGVDTTADLGGTSWGTAWGTLSYAVQQLNAGTSAAFTEIWVAHGPPGHAYHAHASNPAISIFIRRPVIIRGGFDGTEVFETDRLSTNPRTRLSGDIAGSVNTYRLVDILLNDNGPVEFDKFEIEGGDGRSAAGVDAQKGSAIHTNWSGTEIDYDGPLRLIDCYIHDNHARWSGGAIHAVWWYIETRDSIFENNSVAGMSGNPAGGSAHGGAIALEGSRLNAMRTEFRSNKSEFARAGSGGAIATLHGAESIDCRNCSFIDNTCLLAPGPAHGQGGAVQAAWGTSFIDSTDLPPPTFVNCLFESNEADTDGGALYLYGGALVSGCTLSGNTAGNLGGGVYANTGWPGAAVLENSILWGNDGSGSGGAITKQIATWMPMGSAFVMRNNCIQDLNLATWPSGNINTDPEFLDPGAGDFRLRACSPARESGQDALRLADILDVDDDADLVELHPLDLLQDVRVKGSQMDMGAYEANCMGDFDGNGTVNGADLGALMAAWGTSDPVADLDCTGNVAGADLGILLAAWGPCEWSQLGGLRGEEQFMMSGQQQDTFPQTLVSHLGVSTLPEAVAVLTSMDFDVMQAVLQSLLIAQGGAGEQY